MHARILTAGAAALLCLLLSTCTGMNLEPHVFTGAPGEVRLITVDPGHFHAALVQKTMYDQVAPLVHVFAPDGPDVDDHLARIRGFNTRADDPTSWKQKLYRDEDFMERMLREKPGNVVVLSGNNRKKAEYIAACMDAGLNVLADKPMCIDAAGLELLEDAVEKAGENGLLLYDIMTERSEITTILQKELAHCREVFGSLQEGSAAEPAVVKESVHHFFKYVSGNPIKRPAWFFDTAQQGEGIVDVTTHLVDLALWETFPEQPIDFESDIVIKHAERWPTLITPDQFRTVTRLEDFPDYLKDRLNPDGALPCFANGAITFTVKGVHVKVQVRWDYQAPEGGGDTHFSVMRGTRANIFIRQGKEQNYRPELCVEPATAAGAATLETALGTAVVRLQGRYPGIGITREGAGWRVVIPDRYRVGHEAHFGQVMERYLGYLVDGRLPSWETANLKAKYATTIGALQLAQSTAPPEGAIVLFDGSDLSKWTEAGGGPAAWTIRDGAATIVPNSGSIVTRDAFRDFRLHVEFRLPRPPAGEKGQARSNSGVYLQRRYEIQILDSFDLGATDSASGAIYRARAPDENVCGRAGEWQSFDILFRSARWAEEGGRLVKTGNARITVRYNGVLVHKDVAIENKTGAGRPEGPEPGPILLQDHGYAVSFRNIWIVPLD